MMSTLELAGTVISFAIILCVPPFSTSIVTVASLSVILEQRIKLILFAYSAAAVTRVVVNVVVNTETSVTALIVATFTILGIAFFYSPYSFNRKRERLQ